MRTGSTLGHDSSPRPPSRHAAALQNHEFCPCAAPIGITLVAWIALPFAYPPLRRGIRNSSLLKAGANALLGTKQGN